MYCSVLQMLQCVAVGGCVLQCAAVCCSVLQCGAVWCSVVQCVVSCNSEVCSRVAVCCSVLQCVAVCCSVFASCNSGVRMRSLRKHICLDMKYFFWR